MRASEFIPEHEMVWSRTSNKPKLKWRCTHGIRKGRIVPNASDCGKSIDTKRREQMRRTRAKTPAFQKVRAKKTKKTSVASRLLTRLNKQRKT